MNDIILIYVHYIYYRWKKEKEPWTWFFITAMYIIRDMLIGTLYAVLSHNSCCQKNVFHAHEKLTVSYVSKSDKNWGFMYYRRILKSIIMVLHGFSGSSNPRLKVFFLSVFLSSIKSVYMRMTRDDENFNS